MTNVKEKRDNGALNISAQAGPASPYLTSKSLWKIGRFSSQKLSKSEAVLFLSAPDCLCLPLSPSSLFLPPSLPSGLHCCLCLDFQCVLNLQAAMPCYPRLFILPPFGTGGWLGAWSMLREILFVVYHSYPCDFSWLLEMMSLQCVTPCKAAEGWLQRVVHHSLWVLEACRQNTKTQGQIHD